MITGALFAAIAVMLGAFGAHALKAMLAPDKLAIFETGVRYEFYHSIALFVAGIAHLAYPGKATRLATTFFVTGILLFSGSLYAMAMLSIGGVGIGPIGILTPIGGLFFIAGWAALLINFIKSPASTH